MNKIPWCETENTIKIFGLWRICQTQKNKIMKINVQLYERNTPPERNIHNKE